MKQRLLKYFPGAAFMVFGLVMALVDPSVPLRVLGLVFYTAGAVHVGWTYGGDA